MREIEKQIQEKRTIEATKKKLMGFNGKIGCIARNLGQPIIEHSSGGVYHEYGSPIDFWDEMNEKPLEDIKDADELMMNIPTMEVLDELGNPIGDMEGKEWSESRERSHMNAIPLGWFFDGLSRGMHLEIKYEEAEKSLTVFYKGYEVYKEMGGELFGYAPHDEWENKIEQLYVVARKINEQRKNDAKSDQTKIAEKIKDSWWERTRKKWGL